MPILILLLCESNKCQCFKDDGGPDSCPPSLDPCMRIKPQCSKGRRTWSPHSNHRHLHCRLTNI